MPKKLLYFFSLSILFLFLSALPISATEKEDTVSVNVFNNMYYGTLEKNNDGESVFSLFSDQSDSTFTITGNWSEALNSFDGTCIISYQDGTIQEVTFKKGIIKKEVKTTFPDGTYQIFETKNGKPCKKIFTYSKNGTLLDLDWFDHCRSVKELNASAVSLDYETLINTPYNYSDIPVKLSGTVVELYEIPTHGYIKIRDTDNHLFLFNYPNTYIQSAFSTNIENVSVGDTIDIYGTLDSINDYTQNQLSLYEHSLGYQMDFDTFENLITDSDFLASIKYCSTIDDNDLKKPIPVFNAYYWQTNETNIDPLHLTFSYEEICKYPYYYKDEDLSVTGKVIYEELNSSGNRATLLIKKRNSSEIYGTTYKAEDYSPLLGKTVSCSGSSDGNRKIAYYNMDTQTMGYALFPNIKLSKLNLVSN